MIQTHNVLQWAIKLTFDKLNGTNFWGCVDGAAITSYGFKGFNRVCVFYDTPKASSNIEPIIPAAKVVNILWFWLLYDSNVGFLFGPAFSN